jgi:tripartite-type tricarboxylate transporter receptor subunit TctC
MQYPRIWCGWLMAALCVFFSGFASAQEFPTRPVRMIYVFTGGGVSDLLARVTAQKLGEQLGQTVIVENKPGAGGLIGTRETLRSQPLGYTLLFSTSGLVGNLHAFKDPGYKLEDFAPIGVVGEIPFAMIVHDSVGAKTVPQFIAAARANPGKFNYGSIGPSSGGTILSERLKQAAGINLVMIPFKGGEPASVALYAGDIHIYFATLGVARQRMKNPRIVGLAVTSEQRSPAFPDLPTFKESGFPTMLLGTWHAMFVPSAAPRPVIQRLQTAMKAVTASPELKAQLERNDEDPYTGTIDDFIAKMKEESARMAGDYKRLNLPVQD